MGRLIQTVERSLSEDERLLPGQYHQGQAQPYLAQTQVTGYTWLAFIKHYLPGYPVV